MSCSRVPCILSLALWSISPIAGAQEMIDPATIEVVAGSNFDNSADPANRFHEARTLDGETIEGDRDAHLGTHWLAANGTFTETITFDLGAAYSLTSLKVLNTSNTNWNDSETDTFTIATSTDGGGSFTEASDPVVLQDFSEGFQDVPLLAVDVTHVQLVVTNDGTVDGDPPPANEARVGLNEVQFFQMPGADSDGDDMIDSWEIDNFGDLSRDGSEDEDLPAPDGLTNKDEHDRGTDPKLADTDEDGLTDGDEVDTHGTNPLVDDTDEDTLSDGDEVLTHGSDPLSADGDEDTLSDADEINTHGTNPNDPDTDGDGLRDDVEIFDLMTDPLVPNEDPRGSQIDPATINVVAGSNFDNSADPGNRFHEARTLDGETIEGNRDAHLGTHWLAANGTFTETITFDLGGSYSLTNLEILNTSNTNWNDSETDRFTVATSTDGGASFSDPGEEIELQDFALGFQVIPFQAGGVTHVQLVVTNDMVVDGDPPPGSEARVGLNEVRFFTGPGRPFIITSVERSETDTTVIFNSDPGVTYAIDFSFDLVNWLEADDGLLATSSTTTYVDSDPDVQAMPNVFYRARRLAN